MITFIKISIGIRIRQGFIKFFIKQNVIVKFISLLRSLIKKFAVLKGLDRLRSVCFVE